MSGTPGPVAVVLGTRPEIIKMAEVVRLLGQRGVVIHTGQHWDHMMSGHFMTHLALPEPALQLSVGGASRGLQIAESLRGLDKALRSLDPSVVMVQGDTNSAVGGALAANSLGIPLVHVEAGLRSYDREMPEEHNRVVADHLADLCLAPTAQSRQNLLREGIPDDRIAVTGNTVVGAVGKALESGRREASAFIASRNLDVNDFIVATIHRPENTDSPSRLREILAALGRLTTTCPVLLPAHPRTMQRVHDFALTEFLQPLNLLEPLGYDTFVALCKRAALTISDSGGIQEEASVWKKPVVVVRRSTERPEVLGTFASLATSVEELEATAAELLSDRQQVFSRLSEIPSPYGDDGAAARCVESTLALVDEPWHAR